MRLCVCSHIAGSCCNFPGYSEWSPPHLGHEETLGSIFMTNWKEDQGQERDIRGAACGGLVRNFIRRQIRTYALKMMPYHFQSREDKSLRSPRSWGPLKLGLVLSNDLQEKPDRMCRSGAQNDSDVGRPWVRFFSIRKGQGEHRKQEHFPLQALSGPPRGVAARSLSCLLSWHWKLDSVVDHTQPLLSR